MKILRRMVLVLALAAFCVEAALQLAARFVRDRSGSVRPAPITILCVGDSHTYGGGVDADVSYPAWLQRFLDRKAPERFSVVNAGVPGMNTAMVRKRLPVLVERYHPDMILVWVGINDAWNLTDIEPVGWTEKVDALASRSRLYRLIRVRWNDRQLDRALVPAMAANGTGRLAVSQKGTEWEVQQGGRVERITVQQRLDMVTDTLTTERAAANYRGMQAWARTAGLPVAFIAYPAEIGGFQMANAALRKSVPPESLVETTALAESVPTKRRIFLWAAHPNGWIYRAISRRVAELVLAHCASDSCQ